MHQTILTKKITHLLFELGYDGNQVSEKSQQQTTFTKLWLSILFILKGIVLKETERK